VWRPDYLAKTVGLQGATCQIAVSSPSRTILLAPEPGAGPGLGGKRSGRRVAHSGRCVARPGRCPCPGRCPRQGVALGSSLAPLRGLSEEGPLSSPEGRWSIAQGNASGKGRPKVSALSYFKTLANALRSRRMGASARGRLHHVPDKTEQGQRGNRCRGSGPAWATHGTPTGNSGRCSPSRRPGGRGRRPSQARRVFPRLLR